MKCVSCSYPLSQRNNKITDLTLVMVVILRDKLLFGCVYLKKSIYMYMYVDIFLYFLKCVHFIFLRFLF